MTDVDQNELREPIAETEGSGGAERANDQTFVSDPARALDLRPPDMAKKETHLSDYVYERSAVFRHPNDTTITGRID